MIRPWGWPWGCRGPGFREFPFPVFGEKTSWAGVAWRNRVFGRVTLTWGDVLIGRRGPVESVRDVRVGWGRRSLRGCGSVDVVGALVGVDGRRAQSVRSAEKFMFRVDRIGQLPCLS